MIQVYTKIFIFEMNCDLNNLPISEISRVVTTGSHMNDSLS